METKIAESNSENRQGLGTIIDGITNSLRLLDEAPGWNNDISNIVVILSASRSGSSLLYQALLQSNNVAAPAGEHEPWLFLARNKFPFTHSDAIQQIHNQSFLLKLIRNDLLVRDEKIEGSEFIDLLWNRLAIRREKDQLSKLKEIETTYGHETITATESIKILSVLQKNAMPIESYESKDYLSIENPPYITQPHARRATTRELRSKTLLFKSPSDAYRPGFYETLFPHAKITYIHLTRGFAQTVNGLMDGWSKNEIDFVSNPIGKYNTQLEINNYSLSDMTQRYWCFDLFPDWAKYTTSSLADICTQQWLQAHTHILEHFPNSPKIQFESFYTKRDQFIKEVKTHTGIDIASYSWDEKIMATEEPKEFRWMKREDIFCHLTNWLDEKTLKEITELQEKLGYSMEKATWH